MKKELLALSLLTTPCLIAQSDYESTPTLRPMPMYEETGQPDSDSESCCSDSCSCNSCCCTPCCVPQPKKCIDCECYTPQYYDLQCDWGLFLTADFFPDSSDFSKASFASSKAVPAILAASFAAANLLA